MRRRIVREAREELNLYELIDNRFSSSITNIDNYPNFKKSIITFCNYFIRFIERKGIPEIDGVVKYHKREVFKDFYNTLCNLKIGWECVDYIRNEFGEDALRLNNFDEDYREYVNKFYDYIIDIVYDYFGKEKEI